MSATTLVHTLEKVAQRTGENLELLKTVTANSDNIDYGEMVWVNDGTEEGITTLTDRGIECLMDLLKDIRSWPGGIREFLENERCEPDEIARIMADEKA